jgi:hypothetical protein
MDSVKQEDLSVAQDDRSALTRLFNDTRKRLVETGTRNRLIHVNRSNTRGNVISIVNERSDDVYAILSSGKAMRFMGLGKDKDEGAGSIRLADAHEDDFEKDRFTDNQLETRLGPDSLQKRLLKIAREAQTAEEESGVNILYLAVGFVTWFEDKSSQVPREAPLVLLPVELVRNAKTSTFDIRLREEDVMTNLPLQQRLKEDFGINMPDIEVGEDWKPSDYFAAVDEVIAQRDRWKVDIDAIQLGFFSFSKLLMFRDLAIEAWPEGSLADHELTKGLLYEGFKSEPPMFGSDDRLDPMLPPGKLFHVVDADASQAKVIEEVRSGRNLVVQGPPGTGKSQTITNIIAAAVKDGKRVLFVAEKMAALSVVHDRLVKVGLGDVCLELHSRSANKKTVLGELARTIGQAQAVPSMPGERTALLETQDKLNALAEVLHKPIGETGETPFTLLGLQARFIGKGAPPPELDAACLTSMSRDQEQSILNIIEQYSALIRAEGSGSGHPYEGTKNLDLQPVDLARLVQILTRAREHLDALISAMRSPLDAVASDAAVTLATLPELDELLERLEGLPANASELADTMLGMNDLNRLRETLSAGKDWLHAYDSNSGVFVEVAFQTPVVQLRAPLVAGKQSFFARWGGAYRSASRELAGLLRDALPKAPAERVDRVDALCDVDNKRKAWENDKDFCSRTLGDAWRGEKSDFERLDAIAQWCKRLRAAALQCSVESMLRLAERPEEIAKMRRAIAETEGPARSALKEVLDLLNFDTSVFGQETAEQVDLTLISDRFGEMAQSNDRYITWTQLARMNKQLLESGLAQLAEKLRSGLMDGEAAAAELRFARAEKLWQAALERDPDLRSISHEKRHDLVASFTRLERQNLKDNVTEILAGHLQQVPQGAMGEMKVIRGEIGKKRGHIALRRLFEKAGTAIQRIKPVLLMSPISIAQFLPPGVLNFDLLVIDEASQVRPEDALGAIARANQIVVVGDNKQLPPSSFFDRLLADDAENEDAEEGSENLLDGAARVADMESILTLCEARGLGGRMLKWHYRSRDPSLISVSNREFYENGLILPPSPLQEDPDYGLCFTKVNGAYDKGGKRDNRKEGEAIVAKVAQHARENPTLSLGIATFSFAQRNLITELLELNRRSDPVLDEFLREGQSEDVFVKNIENVQGDERDVILVSVGYGPTAAGGRLTSMSFGPVNGEGGERRLNVLFTRARVRCEVFCSFDPGDMDVSRTSGEGPRILKRFLEFAKYGHIDDSAPTGGDADSPFEEDVADVVRSFGFLVDPQVGSAGFRIDMGIRHPDKPGTYLLALECDGATYHSALWARERDRLRQDVLEHLGWRFHRIWSTDWFYNRQAEIERLRQALLSAQNHAVDGVKIDGANKARPTAPAPAGRASVAVELPEVADRQMPAYTRADFRINAACEPHDAPLGTLAELAGKIVYAEGPIHFEEAARRLASAFGKEKAGKRIVAATTMALSKAQAGDSLLRCDGNFWFTTEQAESPPVRDRSNEEGATLKASNISMLEIKAVLRIANEDNAGGETADLVRAAARLLGFRRVGADLQARLVAGLETP